MSDARTSLINFMLRNLYKRRLTACRTPLDVRKVSEPGGGPSVVDLIRRGRCNLVVNTPDHGPEPRSDGYLIREAALAARVPCITTVAAATAAVHAIANARVETALSLQERMDAEAAARAS